ncbi:hypothetical protein D3C76_1005540 [compost metagenome]
MLDFVGTAKYLSRTLLKGLACGPRHPRRPGIGLGTVQQGPRVTIEFFEGDFGGKDEEPTQPIQALHLILEAFFDTTVTLTGQQLEALAQLLLVQLVGCQRQKRSQQSAGHQCHKGNQPGGHFFADEAEHLWTNAMHRHS